MNPEQLIAECRQSGISIRVNGDKIKLRGDLKVVKAAANLLRPHKAELLKYLTTIAADGINLCGPHTPYCCPVSPELVHELHTLIDRYAQLYRLSSEATARIIAAAKRQPLAAIPPAIAFFKDAVDKNTDRHGNGDMPDERR